MEEIKIGERALVEMNVVGFDKIARDYQMRPRGDTRTFWASEESVYPILTKTYEDGLNEAWELAKKIICNIEYGGLHTSELEQIFGYTEFDDVLKNYTPQEASAKIAEWERKQEIRVGDILQDKDTGKEVVVSHTESREAKNIFVIFPDGSCGECEAKDFTKTGRTIDIAGLLAQIGGAEDARDII